ncbi:MAG: hypothetical protein ACLR8U_02110 [Oscillospiraceae bacterium]
MTPHGALGGKKFEDIVQSLSLQPLRLRRMGHYDGSGLESYCQAQQRVGVA